MRRETAKKFSSSALFPGSQSSCVPLWSASSAVTALKFQYFRHNRPRKTCYGCDEKSFEKTGTSVEEGAFCNSDSDLLPPRSRYPLKWARNRQPSPPPVALPGPHFFPHPSLQPLTRPRPCGCDASA